MNSPKARARSKKEGRTRSAATRLAAGTVSRKARRNWNRRGRKPVRFARLRSALSILEKRQDGHHVVSYDPTEREAEGSGRRAQRRSPRGRDEPRQPRGRRFIREGEEDLDDVVRTSRRRQMKTASMAGADVDRIQIEVGAVKALQAKHGIYRGAGWIVVLSLLLWWIPILGPAVAGYIGGRKAGGPWRAAVAALIPIALLFGALSVLAASTAAVPAIVRHFVELGYTSVLGSLPFDFPILGYVLGNLAAIMNSGPDAIFTVLAFALAGGAVTQMKIQERMVPPITARLPASRVVAPMVQAPARALGPRHQAEVDDLVARLNEVLDRAEKERRHTAKARGAAAGGFGPARSRGVWLRFGRGRTDLRYGDMDERAEASSGGDLDVASRQVVTQFLATTPPSRGDRRAKALREPEVEFDLPQTIAFAAPAHAAGPEGHTAAHHYRPSKLYHIYGTSVNPVARAKLEKRLRRTHTLHLMRRRAHPYAEMVEVTSDGGHHPAEAFEPEKPRSLEASALTADLHYDALEHLENASFSEPRKHAAPQRPGEDDLGGLIAHLGEGGEAFVEQQAVDDLDFVAGPVFDRRGRQRARIAGEPLLGETHARKAPGHPAAKKPAAPPAVVRQAIASVEAQTGHLAVSDGSHGKTKIAQSADRAELTPAQKARVDRWLKRTMAAADIEADKARAKPRAAAHTETKAPEPAHEAAPAKLDEPARGDMKEERKSGSRRPKSENVAPAFEITHGSTEVDAEAPSTETESPASKKNRSASEILREIRLQKKAEKEAEAGEELARGAKRAKEVADEIERHAKEGAGESSIPMVALSAQEPAKQPAKPAAKRRRQSEGLEEVETDTEKLSSDLELTLAPIREDGVHITEVGDGASAPVHADVPVEIAGIQMVGAGGTSVSVGPAVDEARAATANRNAPVTEEPERHVKPGDVVLAGPSTDAPLGEVGESELSAADEERIRKRLQEGWNRL